MAVDVNIGTVETVMQATDPDALRSPAFVRQITALVKAELAKEALEDERRAADRSPDPKPTKDR
ncbi:hypothetical protein [Cognatishimia sp. MH4019]|uniref:hypothetical protein n=1 Tax=Cognatishimia sp. MH4019 TaxID=2854030 RepID=UPI001CD48585|nr:hypothetical protein [Cognatishimia sp. MH4019]